MGEVYRAHDTKLGRDVALKLLPDEFARDADRMARFTQEAQILASLNHSNIAAIYGVEDAGAQHALVLELVDGESLAERIAKGPMPIQASLRIGLQITEALDAAHEKGIVHRDLKPANIKITPQGIVKILDFGLARTLQERHIPAINLSQYPTLKGEGTDHGMILGSSGYMSPEQARGKPTDRRADIWAFGVVMFEMLTGRRAFEGETISDSLAKILEREPDWQLLPPRTPNALRKLVQSCLKKDLRERLQSIGDARNTLLEILSEPGDFEQIEMPAANARKRVLLWALVPAIFLAGWLAKPAPVPSIRFSRRTVSGWGSFHGAHRRKRKS
jgi:serine/threonine-protein kinase